MKPQHELKKKILEDMLGKSYEAYVNFKKEPLLPKKRQHRQRIPLWRFILHLLHLDEHRIFIEWDTIKDMEFRIKDPAGVASLWGSIKDKGDMTYEKLGRAMRYYYGKNIIEKVAGKRYSYKFILSRKTKKYIDEFSRRNSVSSSGSLESDEISSLSEGHSDFDIKDEDCKSPDSGCTELTNDSDESPDFAEGNIIAGDFWDVPWQDLISYDKPSNLLCSTQAVRQGLSGGVSRCEVKQESLLDEEESLLADSLIWQPQGTSAELLLDCKPLSDLLFQQEGCNMQYFLDSL